MTVSVPQDSNKRKGELRDDTSQTPQIINANFEGKVKVKGNEDVLPPQPAPVGMRLSEFYGGVEAYNEQSTCVKYRNKGVQTSFYESTPSTQDPLGNKISPGARGNSGYVGTNIPYASEERDNRGASQFPRILLNIYLVRKASGGWCPVIDLKSLNAHIYAPHFRMFNISSVLSTVRKGDYAFKKDLQDA